jgi:multimeric flavodoxin WrbA
MARLLICYHSQSGSSARLAEAARRGAQTVSECQTQLVRCADAGTRDLASASGLLLCCAENSGRLSGGAKDFLDRVFYPSIEAGLMLPYALLIAAGNDGRNAIAEAQRIFSGIPFKQAVDPVIARGEVAPAHLEQAATLGEGFASGLAMGIF